MVPYVFLNTLYKVYYRTFSCRFTEEEKAKRPQLSHMPFGWGPRNCVGMRFALLEAKIALIHVLRKYRFVRAADTEVSVNEWVVDFVPMTLLTCLSLRNHFRQQT